MAQNQDTKYKLNDPKIVVVDCTKISPEEHRRIITTEKLIYFTHNAKMAHLGFKSDTLFVNINDPRVLYQTIPYILQKRCSFELYTTKWDEDPREVSEIPEASAVYKTACLEYGLIGLLTMQTKLNIEPVHPIIDYINQICILSIGKLVRIIPNSDTTMNQINRLDRDQLVERSVQKFQELYGQLL